MKTTLRRRLSRFERLEDRLNLSAAYQANVIAAPFEVAVPVAAGLAPMLLPSGLAAPPGTTLQPPPPPGNLPPGLLPIVGAAEQKAVGALAAFSTAHPGAQTHVGEFVLPGGRLFVVVSMNDGGSLANYFVNDGPGGTVLMSFGENDLVTGLSEMIYATQTDPNNGGSIVQLSQNGALQSLTYVSLVGGQQFTFTYTPT